MTQPAQQKVPTENPISIRARIWRAVDKLAVGYPAHSPEREAEYAARQELRKIIDDASRGNR